jgi:predicted  nucleic acid-binding Zn-ribbon protein
MKNNETNHQSQADSSRPDELHAANHSAATNGQSATTADRAANPHNKNRNTIQIRRYSDSDVFDVQLQGLTDGVMGIQTDDYQNFQEFLEKELTTYKEEILRLDDEIRELKAQIEKTRADDAELHALVHEKEAEKETLTAKIQESEQRRLKIEAEIAELNQNIQKYEPSTNPLSIILLLLASAAFVAGEYIVNVKIVADALKIESWSGYVFAVGLAAVSVLLKPAYDRLLEKPYLDARPKQSVRFVTVMSVVAVLVLATAYFLGEFRFDTEAINKLSNTENEDLKERMGDKLDKIQDDLTLESITGVIPKFSFILSAILFALGGTICLSVALTAIEYRTKRNKLRKTLTGMKGELTQKSDEKLKLIDEKNKVEATVKTVKDKISKLPKMDELQKRLNELKAERLEKAWQGAEYEWMTANALYRNSRDRGAAIRAHFHDKPEFWEHFFDTRPNYDFRAMENGYFFFGGSRDGASRRRTVLRPHVALKQAISAKFRDDCQKNGYFGSDDKNYDVQA